MRLYLKIKTGVVLPLLLIGVCSGQELRIGDRCPDVMVSDHSGDAVKSFQLSDVKAKLIILDFWATNCTSCVKAFPKIDSLQQKFGGQVQFILVNPETFDSTTKFFAKRKSIKKPRAAMMMGDNVFHDLFPHKIVPHHVWLDSNRTVRYITDGFNATEKYIDDFLEGKQLDVGLKKDEYIGDDLVVRRITDWKKDVAWYSCLSHCITGLDIGNATLSTVDGGEPNRLSRNCMSISQLCQTAFGEGNKYDFEPMNRVILEVRDKSKYQLPQQNDESYAEWNKKFCYNYELLMPPGEGKNIYKVMQKDLERYFDIEVTVEKRKIKCLLLVATGSLDKLNSKGGKPATNFWRKNEDSILYMRNLPFEQLQTWLERLLRQYGLTTPMIDLMKMKENIDFEISKEKCSSEKFDLVKLKKALRIYNMDLVEELYLTPVLVIRDSKEAVTRKLSR